MKRLVATLTMATLLGPLSANAVGGDAPPSPQVAQTFTELAARLRLGARLAVTDRDNRTVTGTLVDLSPSSVTLREHGTIPARQIQKVVRPRHFGGRGFLIGLGAGAAVGLTLFNSASCGGDPSCEAVYGGLGLLTTAIGSAAGWAVGRFMSRPDVLFEAQPPPSSQRLTIAPFISTSRRGVAASLSF